MQGSIQQQLQPPPHPLDVIVPSTLRPVFFIVFHLNTRGSNPCNFPITTEARNIDWHSFNFDQLFFVFLIFRDICTSKLKHFIVSAMIS